MTDGTREDKAEELAPHGCTAVALNPGWMRSETMLDNDGVTEPDWRDEAAINPHFAADPIGHR